MVRMDMETKIQLIARVYHNVIVDNKTTALKLKQKQKIMENSRF